LGRRPGGRAPRQLPLPRPSAAAGRLASGRGERLGRPRARRQRLGVDGHRLRALPRLCAAAALPGLLGRLLRRRPLRPARRLVGPRGAPAAAQLPHLVPAPLPLRLLEVPPLPRVSSAQAGRAWRSRSTSPALERKAPASAACAPPSPLATISL